MRARIIPGSSRQFKLRATIITAVQGLRGQGLALRHRQGICVSGEWRWDRIMTCQPRSSAIAFHGRRTPIHSLSTQVAFMAARSCSTAIFSRVYPDTTCTQIFLPLLVRPARTKHINTYFEVHTSYENNNSTKSHSLQYGTAMVKWNQTPNLACALVTRTSWAVDATPPIVDHKFRSLCLCVRLIVDLARAHR
jgi:hypothetical protein